MIALAAIDVAAWDLHSRQQGLPLGIAMCGSSRKIPVYASDGFYAHQDPLEAAERASEHCAKGFKAVKPRVVGERSDELLLDAIRRAIPNDATMMADANERCDLPRAKRLMSLANDSRLLFVEEPLEASSVWAYGMLAQSSTIGIAIGEHLQARSDFVRMIASGAASVIQPDLAMIGGLTPVLELATVAEWLGVALSPHFLPGLFAHVAICSPAVKWLEQFPLIEPLFEGWPTIEDGEISVGEAPGHGLSLIETSDGG